MHRLLLVPTLLFAPQVGPAQEPVPEESVDTSRAPLLPHRKLRQAMTRLASEHPELVSVLNVGTSRGGREIEALRIAAGEQTQGRPAILVVAGLDGPLVYTSGVALEHARGLAAGYATDEAIRALLDGSTVYLIPRANPDACEARFGRPLAEVRATGYGVDNDRDGRLGESGPTDVDGDGRVAHLRISDPEGEWMEDPADARVMVRADAAKGERGRWKLVPEGLDGDDDGEVAEDPELDAVVNSNFPARWKEHDAEAGLFPTDEPEVRALCDFVVGRKDLQVVLTYGDLSNLVGELKSVEDDAPAKQRIPPDGYRASDTALLEEIGRRYREITSSETEGSGSVEGSFQEWCYAHRGLFALNVSPWSIPLDRKVEGQDEEADDAADEDAPKLPKPSDDAKRMIWIDQEGETARHLGWTAFDHPDLGPVEVGGFAPYALVEPPDDERVRIADRELEFLVALGGMLARVEISGATARDLGGGVLEVEAALENFALLPLLGRWARDTRTTRPAKVQLRLPDGATLLAGKSHELVAELPGAGGRHELRWLVGGAPASAVGISVETDHAGTARAVPEVE